MKLKSYLVAVPGAEFNTATVVKDRAAADDLVQRMLDWQEEHGADKNPGTPTVYEPGTEIGADLAFAALLQGAEFEDSSEPAKDFEDALLSDAEDVEAVG